MQGGLKRNQGVPTQMDYLDQQSDGIAPELRGLVYRYAQEGKLKLYGTACSLNHTKNQVFLSHTLTQEVFVQSHQIKELQGS